jgi:polysaccharide deacetylase 2 family uncharacterized protein YibQ
LARNRREAAGVAPDDMPPEDLDDDPAPTERNWRGWRGLGLFWACVGLVLVAGGVTLQLLGPPAGRGARLVAAPLPPAPVVAGSPGRTIAGPAGGPSGAPAKEPIAGSISAPDPALLEATPDDASGAGLPHIAADGRTPMQVYAARFDRTTKVPRIAVLIAGVGLDEAASEDAIRALPAAMTLAISPYAKDPAGVAYTARQAGHEYLVSIPLEPQGYALNDPGRHALLTSISPADNTQRLYWVLSRLTGYVGATGALGDMHGERFAAVPDEMNPMLASLAARGLLYVDPRPGAAPLPDVWSRTVDVVIDDPPSAASIDARLAELEKRAHDTGVALGLVGTIRPVTMEHLVAWVGNLAGRGYALAPVSAIVTAPAKGPDVKAPQ